MAKEMTVEELARSLGCNYPEKAREHENLGRKILFCKHYFCGKCPKKILYIGNHYCNVPVLAVHENGRFKSYIKSQ